MTTEAMRPAEAGGQSGGQAEEAPRGRRNDWRVLLFFFTLAGVVESQAFGHLTAFTPLFLQQLNVPRAQIPTWTGILAALADILASPTVVRLFALYFLASYGISVVQLFIPIQLERLYTGPAALLPSVIGVTLTGAGIAMAITTPLWGRLGDLVGRWRVLPVCIAAVGTGLAAEALAPSLRPMQYAIFGVGLFQGAIGTTVIALLALLAPVERRASILNFSLIPTQLSWLVGPITGAAVATAGIRVPFAAGAAVLAIAFVLACMVGATTRRAGRGTDTGAGTGTGAGIETEPASAGGSGAGG